MKLNQYRGILLATSILAAPAAGLAQSQPSSTVQEVVVTARRQAENILNVPMSIQAVSGTQLSNSGINNVTQLQFTTPGYLPSTSAGSINIFVRGIGNSTFFADPSVATFVDDIPRIAAVSGGNLADVQRIEILKGAQGGLYGRNATGGVLNIITRQPTNKFTADGTISYGEKNTLKASGYVNLPINDKVAMSVSFDRESHDNYIKNLNTNPTPYTAAMFENSVPNGHGGTIPGLPAAFAAGVANTLNSGVHIAPGVGNQDFWTADTKIRFQPVENFKVTLAADYSHKNDSMGYQVFSTTPGILQASQQATLRSFGLPATLPPGMLATITQPFTISLGTHSPNNGFQDLQDYGGSVTAVWNVPHVDITSLTAYRRMVQTSFIDFTASTLPFGGVGGHLSRSFVYQELRFQGNDSGPFHWLGGATYLENTQWNTGVTYLLPPLYKGLPVTTLLTLKNYSIYAQGAYDLTHDLSLTASIRYVHDSVTGDFTSAVPQQSVTLAQGKVLPSVTLSYKLPGEGNVYFRWAEGFKAGGVNTSTAPNLYPPGSDVGKVFGGEDVDTYEVGIHAPLLERKMQVTLAVFYNDYKNLQTSAYGTDPLVSISTVNVQAARTYGVEGSVTWRVIPPLTLGLNAGYLNATYTKFVVAAVPIAPPPNCIPNVTCGTNLINHADLSGQPMTNAPKFQGAFTADLNQPLNDRLNLIGSLLVSYVDTVIYGLPTVPGFPKATAPSTLLVNLRAGVSIDHDKYEIALVATNLGNRPNYSYGNSGVFGDVTCWGDPRIIRAEIKARF